MILSELGDQQDCGREHNPQYGQHTRYSNNSLRAHRQPRLFVYSRLGYCGHETSLIIRQTPTVMVNTGWYQRLRLAFRRHDPRRRGLTLPIPIGAGTYARRDEGCNQRNQNLLH